MNKTPKESKTVKQSQPKKLTPLQKKFVEEMANPKIKSVRNAAINAGFAVSTASTHAYKMLEDARISDAIQKRINRALTHHQVTPEEVIGAAVFQMRSSLNDVLDESGSFSLKRARETGAVDLLKKHKETVRTTRDNKGNSETTKTIEVEMLTNQDGRKEVANYIEVEKAPRQSIDAITDEALARELFRRLIENRGWKQEEAIAGIEQRFPEIDINLLTKNVA